MSTLVVALLRLGAHYRLTGGAFDASRMRRLGFLAGDAVLIRMVDFSFMWMAMQRRDNRGDGFLMRNPARSRYADGTAFISSCHAAADAKAL